MNRKHENNTKLKASNHARTSYLKKERVQMVAIKRGRGNAWGDRIIEGTYATAPGLQSGPKGALSDLKNYFFTVSSRK
ncbi:hypothetical protein GWI33_016842 [Rhynchophorus ferrugineus]|uniref:Uncharacterized protein n=1 Tax=Rhynchophorus ferrugineus TaxID=354439 RepID=A0A834M6R6_RHYFE|nr:hypothetical protein GWI33_016842 [Rhynchophorus ferrugineus]